jgi:hypothetical protein
MDSWVTTASMDLPTTEYDQARARGAGMTQRVCQQRLTLALTQAAAEREAAGAGRSRQQKRRDEPPPAHGGGNVGHAADEVRACRCAQCCACHAPLCAQSKTCLRCDALRCAAMRYACDARAARSLRRPPPPSGAAPGEAPQSAEHEGLRRARGGAARLRLGRARAHCRSCIRTALSGLHLLDTTADVAPRRRSTRSLTRRRCASTRSSPRCATS